jgi:hypothetical protein
MRAHWIHIPDDDVEHNDSGNDTTLDVVFDGKGEGGDGNEYDSQGIGNLLEKDLPERGAFGTLDGVGTVPGKPGGSFFATQPIFKVGVEKSGNALSGESMSRERLLYGHYLELRIGGFRYRGFLGGSGRRVRSG